MQYASLNQNEKNLFQVYSGFLQHLCLLGLLALKLARIKILHFCTTPARIFIAIIIGYFLCKLKRFGNRSSLKVNFTNILRSRSLGWSRGHKA